MTSALEGQGPAVADVSNPAVASATILATHPPITTAAAAAASNLQSGKPSNKDKDDSAAVYKQTSRHSLRSPSGKATDMDHGSGVNARSLVRLTQCKQCSIPLRTPMTLPCGSSICPPCLPERHKRENISFPAMAIRREAFICPFSDCGREHSVADCAVDVTLTKTMERISLCIAQHRANHQQTPLLVDEKLRPQTEAERVQFEAAGSQGPVAHSRIEHGGYIAVTYTLAEKRELRYDSDVEFTAQDIPVATYNDLDAELFSQLQLQVRQEMDCQLCWNLLHYPLTTPCGHTFCRTCAARALGHSSTCPVCRKALHLPPGLKYEARNKLLQSLLEAYCATDVAARTEAFETEHEEENRSIPLFVCTLAYPGMPTFLHIFEPRYRLMIRRVLESESRTFGMAAYNTTRTPQGDDLRPDTIFLRHGTLLRIVNAQPYPDGRIMIECIGVSRFDVREWHEQDGYLVATMDRIGDVGLEEEERIEVEERQRQPAVTTQEGQQPDPLEGLDAMSTMELLNVSVDFVTRMREASAPWLNATILHIYGEPPYNDPRMFPYWFASVLPISEAEKYALMGTTSVRERVRLTARWVRRIEAQRW